LRSARKCRFEDNAVARYFLLLRDGNELLPDDGDGQEFATLDAMRKEVTESARQILGAAVLKGTAASLNLQIEVVDGGGKTVLIVPVGRAVGTETQP
jgi:hypothetical protein